MLFFPYYNYFLYLNIVVVRTDGSGIMLIWVIQIIIEQILYYIDHLCIVSWYALRCIVLDIIIVVMIFVIVSVVGRPEHSIVIISISTVNDVQISYCC